MTSPRTVQQLLALQASGARHKYLFFWGHTPARDGSVTKACFSQWWAAPFAIDGITYPTAEHWMMASKSRLFGDSDTLAKILSCGHPKQAKDLGRGVTGFDEITWLAHRFDLVVRGNEAKFRQHPPLRDFLLGIGERILVEASPVDRIWGIGLAENDDRAEKPGEWQGLNLLGFALMEVRDRLRMLES